MNDVHVIIPWCDRPELACTLAANRDAFAASAAHVIVVNCGGDKALLTTLLSSAGAPYPTVLHAPRACFNKAAAQNAGAAAADGGLLLLLDTDVIFNDGGLDEMRAAWRPGVVVTARSVRESGPSTPQTGHIEALAWSIEVVTQGRSVRVETNRVGLATSSRSAPGIALVDRRDFIAIGGANGRLEGWGFEDIDLLLRLGLVRGLERVEAGGLVHLTHGDDVRVANGSPSESEARNRAIALALYDQGDLSGTYESDRHAFS